jgi:hypothetical protein
VRNLQVSAFNMNNDSILTVKDGEELVTSGVFTTRDLDVHTIEVDFGFEKARVVVLERNYDPEIVGVEEGQIRFTWQGLLEVED